MAVSVAASRPPVHDSAVASKMPLPRHASSRASASAMIRWSIMSGSIMGDPSWQAHRGGSHGRDPAATSDEAETSMGGGLDADLRVIEAKALGEIRTHRIAMGPDARCLADEGHIDMHDFATARLDPGHGVFEKQFRGRAPPACIRRREVNADIAVGDRAEQSVGQRMHADIGVTVAHKFLLMRDAHAAQDHRVARTEGMHVVAGSYALRAESAQCPKPHELIGARDVFCRSELAISFRAFDQRDVETVPLSDAGIVCESGAVFRRSAMRGKDRIETEALRGLRAPQVIAGEGAGRAARVCPKQGVSHREAGQGAGMTVETGDDAPDQCRIDKGTRGVMDQNALRRARGKRLEPRTDGVLAPRTP